MVVRLLPHRSQIVWTNRNGGKPSANAFTARFSPPFFKLIIMGFMKHLSQTNYSVVNIHECRYVLYTQACDALNPVKPYGGFITKLFIVQHPCWRQIKSSMGKLACKIWANFHKNEHYNSETKTSPSCWSRRGWNIQHFTKHRKRQRLGHRSCENKQIFPSTSQYYLRSVSFRQAK